VNPFFVNAKSEKLRITITDYPLPNTNYTRGWRCELAQRLTSKGFQTGGVIYFGAQRLVNGSFNVLTTYILMGCTFSKQVRQFMGVGR